MDTVLVTGSSRGIGRGIALSLAASGCRVAVHFNHNRDAALDTAERCLELGGVTGHAPRDLVFQADITVSSDRVRLVDEIFDRLGSVNALVNNAGMAARTRKDILEAEEGSFEEVLKANLQGPYFLTQLVARRWLENQDRPICRIVFISSAGAAIASVGHGEYCVSKAGLSMAASLFAARLAGEGIPVFDIRPGFTSTDMTSVVREQYESLISRGVVPQGRWGRPEDVGSVVAAIMQGRMDFCAGSVIHPDGGLHIQRL